MSTTTAAAAETEYHYHYVSSEEKYEYSAVSSAQPIRLLILHVHDKGSANTVDAPLAGAIIHSRVNPASKYVALCPIIDSRPATKTIETPEGSIAIAPALHDALSALRRVATSALLLWTPDICLDSSNDNERQTISRIRDMRKIYASSHQVVAFLGADDEDTADAHELFFKLADIDPSVAPTSLNDLEMMGIPQISHISWAAAERFLCRPWFRSIQALPACALAKNLQFMGEHWSLNSDTFIAAMINVIIMQLPLFGQHDNSDELIMGTKCFSSFSKIRAQHLRFGRQYPFTELLRLCKFVEADSVLEKLAILAAVSDKSEDPALWGENDDTLGMSEADHALRIVRFFFDKTDEGLELLSLAPGCLGDFESPSWMPDVSGLKRDTRGLNWSDFQTATGDNMNQKTETDQDKKLTILCAPVPCACVGHNTIMMVSKFKKPASESRSWFLVLARWKDAQAMCKEMRSEIGEPFTKYPGSDEAPLEAIWSTLCKSKVSQPNFRQLYASISSAKAIFMALSTENMTHVLTQEFENAKYAMEFFADELEGWRFCVTSTGAMGLVPQETEVGDVIMAVAGAPVPFVFRIVQESQNYRLVGEAYLHGIMDGEVKEKLVFNETVVV